MNKLKTASFMVVMIGLGFVQAHAEISSALLSAIENHKTAKITRLARKGVDVNATDEQGDTPLILAYQQGHKDTIPTLLKAGANPNIANANGTTVLMLAADNGDAATVALLLQYKAKANLVDGNGYAALFFASGKGYTQIMKQLLAARARVNRQSNDGTTPLHWAVRNNKALPIQLLLKQNAYLEFEDNDGYTPALTAAATGKTTSLDTLRKAGANLEAKDRQGNSALLLAIKNGHADTANYLLDSQSESFEPQSVAAAEMLTYAAGLENPEESKNMTQFLLDRGVSVQRAAELGKSPLAAALKANNPQVVTLLLQTEGKDIDARTVAPNADTLLTDAVRHQDVRAVKTLLAAGANPNTRAGNGQTPLQALLTSPSCKPDILQELLNAGVNPNEPVVSSSSAATPIAFLRKSLVNAQNMDGQNPFVLGNQQQNTEGCITVLKQAGGTEKLPKRNAQTIKQEKQLFAAARAGKASVVSQLVANGISANIIDEKGNTPLMEAARRGNFDAAKQLLQAGADPDMRNSKGQTAFSLAVENKQVPLFALFLNENVTDTLTPLLAATDSANIKLVKALMQAGLDIDTLWDGKTLLMTSIVNKQNKRAMMLLDAGADVNKVVDGYKNALYFALEAENDKMARILEEKGARLTPQGEQQIHAFRVQKIANNMATLSAQRPQIEGMNISF